MSQVIFGVKLTADGKELVAAVDQSKQSTRALGEEFARTGGMASEATARMGKGLGQSQISTAQLNAALRGVPAQFTDIFTSIAGGQAPMTVLLQQGGQLKDMFGGTGAAARALGGYVLGLINPFTVAAASVAGLAFAFKQGGDEADQLRRTLIETGGVAGVTGDHLQDMARKVAASTSSTQGAATEVLNALAGSGTVAAASFDKITRAALALQSAGGPAALDTAKQFAELGAAPVEASKKLNDQAHYLTLTLYKQIEALKNSGNITAAASLAQNAWADALNERVPKLKENLGTLEASWKAVTGVAKSAWDAMLDIGREQTPEQKLAEVNKELVRAAESGNLIRVKFLAAEATGLQKSIAETTAAAKAKGEAQAEEDAGIKQLDITRRTAAAQLDVQQSKIKASHQEYSDTIKRSLSESSISYAEYWALVEKGERDVAQKQLAIVQQQRSAASSRGDNAEAIKLQGEADVLRTRLKSGISAEVGRGLADAVAKQKKEAEDIGRALDADFRKTSETRTRSAAAEEMTESQRRLADALNTVTDRARTAQEALDAKFPEKERGAKAYVEQVKHISDAQEAAAQSAREWNLRQDELSASWETGASKALRTYLDEVQNVAKQSEQAFGRAFQGMEDALVNFVKTGKLDFSSLADSIISDLIRIQVRQAMTAAIGGSSGGGLGGFLGSLLRSGATASAASAGEGAALSGSFEEAAATLIASAKGNVFTSPDLHQYANTIASSPTLFKFAKGAGVFGEAGPEAIMPLTRGSDGNLGVRAHGSGSASGGNAPSVVIYDQRGASSSEPVTTSMGSGPDGSPQLLVFIEDKVNGVIRSGKADASLRARFGLGVQVTRR